MKGKVIEFKKKDNKAVEEEKLTKQYIETFETFFPEFDFEEMMVRLALQSTVMYKSVCGRVILHMSSNFSDSATGMILIDGELPDHEYNKLYPEVADSIFNGFASKFDEKFDGFDLGGSVFPIVNDVMELLNDYHKKMSETNLLYQQQAKKVRKLIRAKHNN